MMHSLTHLPSMRLLFLFVTAITLSGCGPDLNSPASTSVTGKWQSPDSISFFYNVQMELTQTPGGDIAGAWTSKVIGGHLSCPEGTTCSAANTLSGHNTVVGVTFEILGIGGFSGQLENGNVLRGDVARFDGAFKVKFTKVP